MHPDMLEQLARDRMLARRREAEIHAIARAGRPRRGWLTNLCAGLARHVPRIRPQPAHPLERTPRAAPHAITPEAH